MRNFKIVGGMLLIFIFMLGFVLADRYDGTGNQPSGLSVTVEGEKIALYACEPGTYQKAFRDYAWRETPLYVPLETPIDLSFETAFPESIKISDFILRENGQQIYNEMATQVYDAELVPGESRARLLLPVNFSAMLSSSSEAYLPGNTIRGFFISCVFDDAPVESYVFILRTDAQ